MYARILVAAYIGTHSAVSVLNGGGINHSDAVHFEQFAFRDFATRQQFAAIEDETGRLLLRALLHQLSVQDVVLLNADVDRLL